ncbi:HD-GYP domain-containing protein [Paenibacillus glufosinatiresistens]|uniref:HD-GYP domain-containing protein n=1 Tax=Paenibacillus glufosinatiresistens TaxID=3070657 RepID=UPI00286DA18F|nr:HD-GYP domain-containing protein [Paenibacillus sp. YX.27]
MESFNHQYLGKELARDVFNHRGVLVLPAASRLDESNLRLLTSHRIYLDPSDVADRRGKSKEFQKAVDSGTLAMEQIFETARHTKSIPMMELRYEVLPFIQAVSESNDFYGVLETLQSKDDYTFRHNIAVGILSTLLGKWMGLGQDHLMQLTIAATLHDIGKVVIPEEVLNKPGKLTKEEFDLVKQHTTFGYEIIRKTVGTNHNEALVALQHHERMDGSGYPHGIPGDQQLEISRVVAVTDVFHAMSSDRPYHKASPLYEILRQMEENVFGVLDPFICRLFIHKMMESMVGNLAELSDGRLGEVLLIHYHDPLRPLLRVEDTFIDLSRERQLEMVRIIQR